MSKRKGNETVSSAKERKPKMVEVLGIVSVRKCKKES